MESVAAFLGPPVHKFRPPCRMQSPQTVTEIPTTARSTVSATSTSGARSRAIPAVPPYARISPPTPSLVPPKWRTTTATRSNTR